MSEILTTKQRLAALAALGDYLQNPDDNLLELVNSARQYNAWFTPENTLNAVKAIGLMLNEADLAIWLEDIPSPMAKKSVGLILAGNIPMVGFHDVICVLASGHKALIKTSSQDPKLIPGILKKLIAIEPGFTEQIEYVEKLTDFDSVIATGSNNTSRYFEYYFSKVPHIIRKNRNSIAIITGNENEEQFQQLGHDIFDYFGLGCRNVSKIYVPRGYDFKHFFEGVEDFKAVIDHHKYNNNYDYNKSIMLVNLDKHLDNGFLLVKEDSRLTSPLGVLYYEEYDDLRMLEQSLLEITDHIQCIVTEADTGIQTLPFGQSQQPKLWDYADGVDTLKFLGSI